MLESIHLIPSTTMIQLTMSHKIVIMLQMGCIGALTRFLANIAAIELLFHPYKPFLGYQGTIIRNKNTFCEYMQNMLSLSKRDMNNFLEYNRNKIPAIGRFVINNIDPNKVSPIINNLVSGKFSIPNKDIEAFCKYHARVEIFWVKISGLILGFFAGTITAIPIFFIK